MTYLLVLAILGAGAHFLLYRAEVTRWLWSRYPAALDGFLGCSACTGFWVGLFAGGAALARPAWAAWAGLGSPDPSIVPVSAIATMVLAPMLSYLQVSALVALAGDGSRESTGMGDGDPQASGR